MIKEIGILDTGDGLDADEIIIIIEESFNIKFDDNNDFQNVRTYGDLENLILNKIDGVEANDCTSQQAFYKLRNLFVEYFDINYKQIKPQTSLEKIFPTKDRIKNIQCLQLLLKTKVNILKTDFYFGFLAVIFIISSIYFFFNALFLGIILFIFGLLFIKFSLNPSKDFNIKSVGELSNFLMINDYKVARSNSQTFNPKEIKQIIKNIFSDILGISPSEINHQTIL